MNRIQMTGHSGEVRHGYVRAARLVSWSFTGSSKGGTLTGQVGDPDTFRLSQAPLRVVLPVGQSLMRWSVRSLQIEGSTLTADLGEKE